jgi:hypothetical protein
MTDWFVVFLVASDLPLLLPVGMSRGLENGLFTAWRWAQVGVGVLALVMVLRQLWRASAPTRWCALGWTAFSLVIFFQYRPMEWDAVVEYDRMVHLSLRHGGLWQGYIHAATTYVLGYPPGATLSVIWGRTVGLPSSNLAHVAILWLWGLSWVRQLGSTGRGYGGFLFGALYLLAPYVDWHHEYFYNNIIYAILFAQLILIPLLRIESSLAESCACALLLVWLRWPRELAAVSIMSAAAIRLLRGEPLRRTAVIMLLSLGCTVAGARLWSHRASQLTALQREHEQRLDGQTAMQQDSLAEEYHFEGSPAARSKPSATKRDLRSVYREAIVWAWNVTFQHYSTSLFLIFGACLFAWTLGLRTGLAYSVPLLTPLAFIAASAAFAETYPGYQQIPGSLVRLEIILPLLAAGGAVALEADLRRARRGVRGRDLWIASAFRAAIERPAIWLDQVGRRLSEEGLISFDRRVLATLGAGICLFAFLVAFRVHGSSSGGADLLSLPTSRPLALLRPDRWGLYFLDIERGFSFYWNAASIGIFLGTLLVALLLTDGAYWLSLLAASWVTWSGQNVWSGPLRLLVPTWGALLAAAYVLCARRRPVIVAAAAAFVWFVLQLVVTFELSWTLASSALITFVLLGLLDDSRRREAFKSDGRFRARVGAIAGASLVACLLGWYLWGYRLVGPLQHAAGGASGRFGWSRLFSGFYDVFLSRTDFPAGWDGAREASSFILLFPVVLVGMAIDRARGIRIDRLQAALMAFIALAVIWRRSAAAVGVASILICVLFLGREVKPRWPLWQRILPPLGLGALFWLHGRSLHANPFYAWDRILLIAIWGASISFALLERRPRAVAALLLPMLLPNVDVNPVAQGLGALTQKRMVQAVEAIRFRLPGPCGAGAPPDTHKAESPWIPCLRDLSETCTRRPTYVSFAAKRDDPDQSTTRFLAPQRYDGGGAARRPAAGGRHAPHGAHLGAEAAVRRDSVV